jgi:glycosyltransferase involved in cell wall biosynthesis
LLEKFDFENIIFFGTSELFPVVLASINKNIKIFVRHGTTKKTKKKSFFHSFVYSKVYGHICISRHLINNVKKIFPSSNNYYLIYNPYDLKPIDDKKEYKFLFVGRVIKEKGIQDAIVAISKIDLPNEEKNFYIVGYVSPEYEYFLKEESKILGVNLFFMGYLEFPEAIYKKSHVFIFPSYGEGLGNVFFEALFSGMSCVCYNNTVFPELKSYFPKNIYMANDRDIEDLSHKIFQALSSSYVDLSEEWENNFSLNVFLEKYSKILS